MTTPTRDERSSWPETSLGKGGYTTRLRRRIWRRWLPALLVMAVGVWLTAAAYHLSLNWEHKAIATDFNQRAGDRAALFATAIRDDRLMLESVCGFFIGSRQVDRDEFHLFIRPLIDQMPGMQAVGWAPRISDARRSRFETLARLDGPGDFQITQPDADGNMVRASRRAEYFPACYIAPLPDNEHMIGFDLASCPVRGEAIARARDSGQITATPPLPSARKGDKHQVVLTVLPLFYGEPKSEAARREALRGFIVGVFRPDAIVRHIVEQSSPQGMDIYLCHLSPAGRELVCFHRSRMDGPDYRPESQAWLDNPRGIFHTSYFTIGGRHWMLLMKPAPSFIAARKTWQPACILLAGLAFTALFTAYVFIVVDRAAAVQGLVAQRTLQLQESRQRLQMIAKSAHDGIVAVDDAGRTTFWNAAATRIFGYKEEEALGRDVHQLIAAPCYRVQCGEAVRWFRESGQGAAVGKTLELIGVHKDGRELPVELSLSAAILDGHWHAVAVIRDIAERKRVEDELRRHAAALEAANKALAEARDAAEAAARAKTAFLANMSHEIRTPMTAILGFSEVLAAASQDPAALEAAETVKRNGQYLLELINNILDLSKIEAGKLYVERQTCSPAALAAEVLSLMHVRAEAKNLFVKLEADGPLPVRIVTDPIRLKQVLINLIGNAVKFTEVGGVRVVMGMQREPNRPPLLRIDVIDTGIGMNEEQLNRAFLPFVQADASTSRRYGGSGLGLSISKRLAQLLGGDIRAESREGQGAVFSLFIDPGPLDGVEMLDHLSEAVNTTSTADHNAKPSKIKLHGRVLLAEDGPDNQRLIAFLLRKAGAEVTLVADGQAAIEAVQAAGDARGAPRPFDVILMDMQMPRLDGYQAAARLREMGYRGPIIALTAHAMSQDRKKCLDAGCDDYLAKPLDHRRLLEIVARWMKEPAAV